MHSDAKLLDKVGTTTQVARMFEVRPQAVSKWRRTGIPSARLQTLRLMRPELFQAPPSASEIGGHGA